MSGSVVALLALALMTAPGKCGEESPVAESVGSLNPFAAALNQATLIAVGTVQRVTYAGRGTEVIRFAATEVLKSEVPRGEVRGGEVSGADLLGGDPLGGTVTIFAARGKFFAATRLLVLLRPFENGPRFECLGRITDNDADFDAKLRVLRQYIQTEAIEDPVERQLALRRLVLSNIESSEVWVCWNALRTLRRIVAKAPWLLSGDAEGHLSKVHARLEPGSFRVELGLILEKLKAQPKGASEQLPAARRPAEPARPKEAPSDAGPAEGARPEGDAGEREKADRRRPVRDQPARGGAARSSR
ncbi:MAG: hypothetical protein AB1486_19150 [Planctomycetota bacterium]